MYVSKQIDNLSNVVCEIIDIVPQTRFALTQNGTGNIPPS